MISTTGRSPETAAPRAVPIIADSEIGVSITLPPNCEYRPLVAPNGPFGRPMSSPSTIVSANVSSDHLRASLTARI